jgi:hypothetical protein
VADPRRGDAASPPSQGRRRLISVGIAAYLTWQVVLPLHYYLRENRRDERFAWRIFSASMIPPYRCDVRVQELPSGSDVDLTRTLHDAWTTALRHGQDVVVERLLHTRCESSALVDAVEFSRMCRRDDGAPAPRMRVRLDCRSGVITQEATG